MSVALYMDVHVHSSVTEQLRRRGIDVLTAQDDDSDNLDDEELLGRSTTLGRVMFTFSLPFVPKLRLGTHSSETPFPEPSMAPLNANR